MAKVVLTDASLVVNGVDLSNRCQSVELPLSREDVESTAMGATGKQREYGLKDEAINVTWRQDFAAGNVDATLFPLYNAGTKFAVVVKPTSAAVSATNPSFTATCLLLEYQPIAGEVGSILDAESSFVVDGVITRATS